MEQKNLPTQNTQVLNILDKEVFATMQRISKMFATSALVPEIYRVGTKQTLEQAMSNCMIAIDTASRIGASPLMVMQNMYIVHGQPAWSAKFLAATVNGCGRYNSVKYKFTNLGKIKDVEYTDYAWVQGKKKAVIKKVTEELDNWECIAYTSEKGDDEVLESIPVTVEMAIKEGWYSKAGSKWQTMPKLMLQYRTVTFWTRAYAPELSMGIKTEDEVHDIVDIPYEELDNEMKNTNVETITMNETPEEETSEPETPVEEPKKKDLGF